MNKNLFDNIDKNKCKRVFFGKYFFQVIIVPAIEGFIMFILTLIADIIIKGRNNAFNSLNEHITLGFISGPYWIVAFVVWSLLWMLPQCLTLLSFFNLIIDLIIKNSNKCKNIEFTGMNVPYEFFAESLYDMNFSCDRFSKKKHLSLYLYDENNKKYRFFWNEKFSTIPLSQVKEEIYKASRLRISYLKHSKIIFRCEVIQYKSIYTHTKA